MQITCDKFHTEWQRCAKEVIISPSAGTRRIVRERQKETCHGLFREWNSCMSKRQLKRRDSIHKTSGIMARHSEK